MCLDNFPCRYCLICTSAIVLRSKLCPSSSSNSLLFRQNWRTFSSLQFIGVVFRKYSSPNLFFNSFSGFWRQVIEIFAVLPLNYMECSKVWNIFGWGVKLLTVSRMWISRCNLYLAKKLFEVTAQDVQEQLLWFLLDW